LERNPERQDHSNQIYT